MIDAATFAGEYHAFWQTSTPTSEHFVRRMNLDGVERFELPMPNSKTTDRAYLAEFAFFLFVQSKQAQAQHVSKEDLWAQAKKETDAKMQHYARQGVRIVDQFTNEQREEVGEISKRLSFFFGLRQSPLHLRPKFNGCGYIDRSEGDVISQTTIFEIKTVSRKFRSSDIHQALTYSALNFCSSQHKILRLGLVNPRAGLYFEEDIDKVCQGVSGKPSQELLIDIVDAISSGDISR